MGSKYTSQTVAGYNSSPPPDDGSTTASNKITWGTTIKAKLADPILTLAQAVNSAIASFTDFSQTTSSSNYTTIASDHMKTIQVTGTTTISLMDATSAGAGYIVSVANYGTNNVTLTRITGSDTLNGATKAIVLYPGAAVTVKVIAAETGYQVIGSYNVMFDNTDPSKQITHNVSGITTGTVRVVTWPDASISVARTDAAQTFTGNQTFLGTVSGNAAMLSPITNSLSGDVSLNNTGNYFTGPTIAQGTSGTWFVSGTVTMIDTAAQASYKVRLWDGTTIIASARMTAAAIGEQCAISVSGFISSPAGNLRIDVNDPNSTSGKISFNGSGDSKDSTITAIRIG